MKWLHSQPCLFYVVKCFCAQNSTAANSTNNNSYNDCDDKFISRSTSATALYQTHMHHRHNSGNKEFNGIENVCWFIEWKKAKSTKTHPNQIKSGGGNMSKWVRPIYSNVKNRKSMLAHVLRHMFHSYSDADKKKQRAHNMRAQNLFLAIGLKLLTHCWKLKS